ncbi:MAG: hypothetical protein JO242_01385, partial [Streptosporangiaceae bacterium]|nr:hypothetical protein [Streptosporangiaceae bacterium]
RTHRQQAFLDSVIQQLRTGGVLSDLTKISALLSVARQYVITDSGWDLLDFAAQMRYLSTGDLVFHTLPIVGYQTIDGQSANVVDPAHIKQIVQQTFYPAASPATAPGAAGAQGTANARGPASAGPSASSSSSPSSIIPTAGPQGGAVSAKNGIPCVS